MPLKIFFSTTQVLFEQVETAAKTEAAGGTGIIEFVNTSKIDTASTNAAPTNISLSKTAINEVTPTLVLGSLSTTDSDQPEHSTFTYSLAELDGHNSFSINHSTGELSFKNQPDFETKSSYKITIL